MQKCKKEKRGREEKLNDKVKRIQKKKGSKMKVTHALKEEARNCKRRPRERMEEKKKERKRGTKKEGEKKKKGK